MHDMTQHHDQAPSDHCFGPKGVTKWNFFWKFHAIGWTKHAEVNFYSLCREHPTKWSLCFKNHAYYSWYDSKSWSDPLSSLFWSQRVHQVTKLFKYLMLEGEPSTLKFTYIATITPNEVCALKNMHALHKMTWHYDQNPSVHCFVPNWCQIEGSPSEGFWT